MWTIAPGLFFFFPDTKTAASKTSSGLVSSIVYLQLQCEMNHPGILPKSRTGCSRSGVGPRACILQKLSGKGMLPLHVLLAVSFQNGALALNCGRTWGVPYAFYKILMARSLPQSFGVHCFAVQCALRFFKTPMVVLMNFKVDSHCPHRRADRKWICIPDKYYVEKQSTRSATVSDSVYYFIERGQRMPFKGGNLWADTPKKFRNQAGRYLSSI
jgi:hypothetical protein